MKITYINDEFIATNAQGNVIGKLVYEKWASRKAHATTHYAEFFDFTPKSFWFGQISVRQNSNEIATVKMNWKGNVLIDIKNKNDVTRFTVKTVGIFNKYVVVQDSFNNELMAFRADSQWKTGHHNYDITINLGFENLVTDIFVLIATYAVNNIMNLQKAAMAAGAS